MKCKLLLAAVVAAAAVLAFPPASATTATSTASTSVSDAAGIAYTRSVVVNAAEYTRGNLTGPFATEVSIDVRGLVAKRRLPGTWATRLFCPAAVALAAGESGSRTGLSAGAADAVGATFALSISGHKRKGHDEETWRCWIRVTLTPTADAEDGPAVDVLLPVDVTYRWIRFA